MASNAHSTPVPRRRVLHLAYRKAYALPLSTGAKPRRVLRADVTALPAVASAPACDTLTAAIYAAGRRLPTDLSERLELLQHRRRILDLAGALLDLADALDGDADLEPEVAEDDGAEASAQPVTLAPTKRPAILARRPIMGRTA